MDPGRWFGSMIQYCLVTSFLMCLETSASFFVPDIFSQSTGQFLAHICAPCLIHLLLTHLTPAKIDNNEKWSGHKVERILKVYFKLRKFSSSMKSFRCLRFRFTSFD